MYASVNWVIVGLGNDLSFARSQVITLINADSLGTQLSENRIKTQVKRNTESEFDSP